MENSGSFSANAFESMSDIFNKTMEYAHAQSQSIDPASLGSTLYSKKILEMLSSGVQVDPSKLLQQQMDFMEKQLTLWQHTSQAIIDRNCHDETMSASPKDARFSDTDWSANPLYHHVKEAYLLNANMLESMVEDLEFKDTRTARQVKFFTRQFISALSPSNYAITNPEVCREALATEGKNLKDGLENFLKDLKESPADVLKICQTDASAFTLGETLANTPGKVVLQTDMMQLLQYSPSTDTCHQKPLLFVPPFINKYYILDLGKKKSMVRWLVSQGFTVFLISWVNPSQALAHKRFDDYMLEGTVAALDAVEAITGESSINTAGYCVGGTLLASTQSYLTAKGDERINSMTFFTTLLDFEEPGEIGNFVSEEILRNLERDTASKGILDGRTLGMSFSMLRENSLLWPYFIDNYLKGKTPSAFDILYWNSDATNLPANTFSFYIRNAYLNNKFIEPKGVTLDGVPLNLPAINSPTYFVAPQADHIALWESVYKGAQSLGGQVKENKADTRFVLAGSGHIAGIINPAETGKYPHWVNNGVEGELPPTPEQWKEQAEEVEGSWWLDWQGWLAEKSGAQIPAREPGAHADFPNLEDAPGSYVKVRL